MAAAAATRRSRCASRRRRRRSQAEAEGGAEAKAAPKKGKAKAKPKGKSAAAAGVDLHRLGAKCPRCRSEWGDHLKAEGREAAYTSFMRGRTQAMCISCLFEFGALTCTHHCPHCAAEVDYRPTMFKQVLTCSRKKCGKSFGVAQFVQSAAKAAEEEARLAAAEQAERRREQAASARAARAERTKEEGDDDDWMMELGAFIVSEDCPYCGGTFTTGHAAHLKACKKKHAKRAAAAAAAGGGGGQAQARAGRLHRRQG